MKPGHPSRSIADVVLADGENHRQLDIVPGNGAVLAELQKALALHGSNLQSGGERVCIAVTGAVLSWKSAQIDGQEVLDQLPAAVRRDHVLIESARIVAASTALAADD